MPTPRLLLLALLLAPVAACDEVAPPDAPVDVVVDDAVVARERGDVQTAERLLRAALQREPQNPKVRVELATTVLQRDGVDLLDLDRIASFLTTGEGAARTRASGGAPRAACPYAADPSATAFDPTEIADFDALAGAAAALAETADLLDPVIPEPIRSFDVCTSVADGALVYDRDGALADLAAQGLSRAQIARALAVNALARFLDAYLFVATEVTQETAWYRLADGGVAVCVADPDALRQEAEGAVGDLGEAVLSLDARASLLGATSLAADLVDVALGAFEGVRDGVADYCSS